MKGRVLIVAGSDSGGGAGIQADIKAVTMMGGYAATAIAALTAQDTTAVHDVFPIAPDFVARQMAVVLDDIGADAIKIGMLATVPIIEAVAGVIEDKAAQVPLVVDPVMVATSGGRLLADDAIEALTDRLIARATLVTPNIPEAEALTGLSIDGDEGMAQAGQKILDHGPKAVLVKGGHLGGDKLVDLLVTPDGVTRFEGKKLPSTNTHGTGCTLASAVATGLAQGMTLVDAVARARTYVFEAIRLAPGFGRGHGPLNHVDPVLGSGVTKAL
ncbi:MAG: bifunctional hydroxymethylpyrimidine kinase/phosphomethylpyrimidine kinase [Alphaproteobacteria bacterium]|nr:MAG: bifunctional hydroxymethylpyrimidine kinase/phosphomethylpyrimidine kinase [Alphaproteobacteria bacterium]